MLWIALPVGAALGGLNFILLRLGCKKLLGGQLALGAVLVLAGIALTAAAMLLCAWRSPALLVYFGCACGLTLPLLAVLFYVLNKT